MEDLPWECGWVICKSCFHSAVSVSQWPTIRSNTECSKCGNFKMFEPITIKALKAALEEYEGQETDIVVLSSDAEGNTFSPLTSFNLSPSHYHEGDVYITHLTKQLEKLGYTEEDLSPTGGIPALVLYPL